MWTKWFVYLVYFWDTFGLRFFVFVFSLAQVAVTIALMLKIPLLVPPSPSRDVDRILSLTATQLHSTANRIIDLVPQWITLHSTSPGTTLRISPGQNMGPDDYVFLFVLLSFRFRPISDPILPGVFSFLTWASGGSDRRRFLGLGSSDSSDLTAADL